MSSSSKKPPERLQCAYRSPKHGRCMQWFDRSGRKLYCSNSCKVKAHNRRTGRSGRYADMRRAALERDGGCVRRNELGKHGQRYGCLKKLVVRVIDPSRPGPRALDNVQTLCTRHSAQVSAERHRARVGDEAFKAQKRVQGRVKKRLQSFDRKLIRYLRSHEKPFDLDSLPNTTPRLG